MRLVLVGVATLVACDGPPGLRVDAGLADGAIDAPVDAPTAITGTWLDTYITTAGSTTKSACTAAPSAVVVNGTTAAVTSYSGACKGDGSFRIATPANLGTYYLKVQGALYETTKDSGVDLSTDRLGRSDVGSITGVNLAFTMTGMTPWTTGDVLTAFGANIGYSENLAFSSGGPTAGSGTLAGTAPWLGYKVDAAKNDALQIVQQVTHTTTGGLAYVSLDRSYDVPAFTMTNNATQSIGGAFTAPPAGTLGLRVNVAAFNQFAAAVNPNTTTRTIAGSAYASPSPEASPSPSLVSFARDSASVTALDFGTLSYGDPFPSAWQRYVKVTAAFGVPYTWNNVTGVLGAQLTRVMTKTEAEAAVIDVELGPPRNPKLDGANAFTATMISPVPVVSWDPPALGTATDYEINVYEVQVNGNALKFVSTLRLATKQTSVRIPEGYLFGQRQYMFVIRARTRDMTDLYTTPIRGGASTSTAETLTALVTTDS